MNFTLNIMRYNGHGNKLAVAMGNTCSGSFAKILEDKNIFDQRICLIQCLHAIPVNTKKKRQVLFAHLMEYNAMIWVVDDDLMVPISSNGLLSPGWQAWDNWLVV